ncbi:hypothetical protein [Yinghuangia soli]|uniref:Uncharacterized protein n=1 Tax=Yinghuangia soli TaxID=2908204 RepID=A0AA41Q0Y0_9ACTN|nr:hypothetical protein [Yinghuangia soli]MCF2528756.1 hypothetical protein [Yinghuangia soli]
MTDDHEHDVGTDDPPEPNPRSSRNERGPWEQKEALCARITELRAMLDAVELLARNNPDRRPVASGYAMRAAEELDMATQVLSHDKHPALRRAAHLAVAQSHVDAAMNLMVWLAPADDVEAMLPHMTALVEEHLPETDQRRREMADIVKEVKETHEISPVQRYFLAETVGLARRLLQKETLRVRSFVRIVKFVSFALAVVAGLVLFFGMTWPETVPLCFAPEANSSYEVVCPTNNAAPQEQRPDTQEIAAVARTADYLVVALAGLVAASVSAAAALRHIRGTALPYDVPVALAVLKLPTGALTATLGLLLMRGGFVPGLTALDSSAQIIAWAIIFGYSQQLFTRFVDQQGQAVLNAVKGSAEPAARAPESAKA